MTLGITSGAYNSGGVIGLPSKLVIDLNSEQISSLDRIGSEGRN
jgi:hypothetical protein